MHIGFVLPLPYDLPSNCDIAAISGYLSCIAAIRLPVTDTGDMEWSCMLSAWKFWPAGCMESGIEQNMARISHLPVSEDL